MVIEYGGKPMTEFLDPARLRQIAVNASVQEPQRLVPVMCWTIEERTQRPVCYWRLDPSRARPTYPRRAFESCQDAKPAGALIQVGPGSVRGR